MKPVDFKKALVKNGEATLKALSILDSTDFQIALVVDENNRLLGTITDGDVRRAILKGVSTSDPVDMVFNKTPVHAVEGATDSELSALMEKYFIKQVPILNKEGVVVGLALSDEFENSHRDTEVILMVGGLGKRLMPLTEKCPKPMLKVGEKPILERIVMQFQKQGFQKFHFAVNYMAHMVEEYFRDGSDWDVNINYIKEEESFGTAGALSLLKHKPEKPFLVMNGDLLTSVNFNQLIDFHNENNSQATMCVREYNFQVPYGVVSLDDTEIIEIKEKPEQKFFVNSGIYVLNPELLELIPKNTRYDMPNLFSKAKEKGMTVSGFPLREYWLDIGQMKDFVRAEEEYNTHFDN